MYANWDRRGNLIRDFIGWLPHYEVAIRSCGLEIDVRKTRSRMRQDNYIFLKLVAHNIFNVRSKPSIPVRL